MVAASNDNDCGRGLAEVRRDNAVASIAGKLSRATDLLHPHSNFTAYRDAATELSRCARDPSVARLERGQGKSLVAATRFAYQQIMTTCAGELMTHLQMRTAIRGPAGLIERWANAPEIRFSDDPYYSDTDSLNEVFDATLRMVQSIVGVADRRLAEAPDKARRTMERDAFTIDLVAVGADRLQTASKGV